MNERRGMRSRGAKEFSNVLFNCILLPPTPRPCLEPFYISMLKCTIAPLLPPRPPSRPPSLPPYP
jgi:hypothetical protein